MVKQKDEYMQFLRGQNALQSGADVYADVEMPTGVTVRGGIGMLIHEIHFFWVPASFVNASWVELQLKTVQGDVAGGMTKASVLWLDEYMCRFTTNGGGWQVVGPIVHKLSKPLLITNDSLWFGIKSNATGVANVGYCRLGITYIKLTQAEYIEALELLR